MGTRCEAAWARAGASEPVVIGADRVGGAVDAGVVCGCRGAASGRVRVRRHELVGQAVLVAAVAAGYSAVAVAALATWLKSPATNISCPQALNKTLSRQSGRLP